MWYKTHKCLELSQRHDISHDQSIIPPGTLQDIHPSSWFWMQTPSHLIVSSTYEQYQGIEHTPHPPCEQGLAVVVGGLVPVSIVVWCWCWACPPCHPRSTHPLHYHCCSWSCCSPSPVISFPSPIISFPSPGFLFSPCCFIVLPRLFVPVVPLFLQSTLRASSSQARGGWSFCLAHPMSSCLQQRSWVLRWWLCWHHCGLGVVSSCASPCGLVVSCLHCLVVAWPSLSHLIVTSIVPPIIHPTSSCSWGWRQVAGAGGPLCLSVSLLLLVSLSL